MLNKRCKIMSQLNGQNSNHALSLPRFVDLTFILMAQPNKENSCYEIFKAAAISLWWAGYFTLLQTACFQACFYGTSDFCFETQMLSTCSKTEAFAKQTSLTVFWQWSQWECIGGVCVWHNRGAWHLGALMGWNTAKVVENSNHIFSETHSNEGIKERI